MDTEFTIERTKGGKLKANQTFPDCYLHIEECRSGEEFIIEIGDLKPLDLPALVAQWVENQFSGELKIDGKFTPRLAGDYYAKIITDGRSPDCGIVWTSGGFYLKVKAA